MTDRTSALPASPATPDSTTADAATAPVPASPAPTRPDPTRYGDWELNGKCVDF